MGKIYLRTLALSLGLWWGLGSSVCQAVTISYLVTLDTTPLANQPEPGAPYSFIINFGEGQVLVDATVTLSHFDFGPGGGPLGSPLLTPGFSSGSLEDTVTIDLGGGFSQAFIPSATGPLRFLLNVTWEVNPFGCCFPGEFLFGIIFGPAFPQEVPSSAFRLDIGYFGTNVDAHSSSVTVPSSDPGCPGCFDFIELDAPTFAVVPEPGSGVLMLSAMLICIAVHRRRIGGGFRRP
jgi:hypothetical protein